MNILLVNKFLYPKGGSESYIFGLARILKLNGHNVSFFGMHDNKNIVNIDDNILVDNIDFHQSSIKNMISFYKTIYSIEARKKIGQAMDRFRPDIVHLNNFNFHLTPSIIYEIKKRKIGIIQTVHDPFLVCPSHSLYNFARRRICNKCISGNYYHCIFDRCIHNSISKSIIGAFEAYLYHTLDAYKLIDHFICPSRFIANKLIEAGFKKDKISIISNFHEYHTHTTGFNHQRREYYLYFGRLSVEKGIKTLLSAINNLPSYRFLIAGTGPMQDELLQIDNLQFLGFRHGLELLELIQNAIATIYPSEWYENCPMSIIESIGLGTPVIASNIGGIPELVIDNFNGMLFTPGSSEQLIQKIKLMQEDQDLRRILYNNLIISAERLSVDRYYDEIMPLYKKYN